MSALDSTFCGWLAAQPAFVEVALGVIFVVAVAPSILAIVAAAMGRLEDKLFSSLGLLEPYGVAADDASSRPRLAYKNDPVRPARQHTWSDRFRLIPVGRELT